jgi:hypothetical protein
LVELVVQQWTLFRQPEASGKIQTAMLIAAALIEGLVSLHYLLLN